MGNYCFKSSSRVDTSKSSMNTSSEVSKFTSQTITSSNPSTLTESSTSSGSHQPPRTEGEILASSNLKSFFFSELKSAARNFRQEGLLGEGGFGCVYKGWIDEETLTAAKPGFGMVVAIKKLKPEGFQGHKEWLAEVNYLGQLHHPNLVKLIGYCLEGTNRLLVYELMSKGSLETHIFKRAAKPLPWEIRIKVALGAARGLYFLHEAQVIYRDFKASNILLDSDYNAKLSDFGLAKDGPTGDRTHVTTQVMGTQGYAAPEYIATGRVSARSDVYGFGVVLLEILSGHRAVDNSRIGVEKNLVDWAKPYLADKRKLFRIMDSKLEGQYPQKGAFEASNLALQCISNDAKSRPLMSEAVACLEKLQGSKKEPRKTNSEEKTASYPIQKSAIRTRSPLHLKSDGDKSPYLRSPGVH